MNSNISEIIVAMPFQHVLAQLKNNIQEAGFLLIHEIKTKEILESYGHIIPELRQLLFFHPAFMNTILTTEPTYVIKVPLKVVIREIGNGSVSLTYIAAGELFKQSNSLRGLMSALDEKMKVILELKM